MPRRVLERPGAREFPHFSSGLPAKSQVDGVIGVVHRLDVVAGVATARSAMRAPPT
ncbi:hypothetical protein [Prescottella agglutinans]|uniref:hypothetical protein n=1 Tax=Prescottella agglutinans TaxID=1644129 RepID=UPI0013E2B4C4|nr:hypothetical protein [Prescottella agglutinans]